MPETPAFSMVKESTVADNAPFEIRVTQARARTRIAGRQHVEKRRIDKRRIIRALRFVLQQHGCTCGTLSVALVDDTAMADLHDRYLSIPTTTDVLTFDLRDTISSPVDGEIVICTDVAARESARRGHSLADEVLLYTVHGCLHLLGYDDHSTEDAARMHAREDQLLVELGVGTVFRRAVT